MARPFTAPSNMSIQRPTIPNPQVAVGDLVRVETGGQIVFEETRVRHIDKHWVFVEASQTGAKMSDVTLLEKAPPAGETPPIFPPEEDDARAPLAKKWTGSR